MLLYDSVGPNPRFVRMFAAERGVTLPKVTVDLRGGENRQAPYLAKNPSGGLPALELDDGFVLAEITAIAEYLDETASSGPSLVGANALERAETRMWTRRIDLQIIEPLTAGFRYAEGLKMFQSRMHCIPHAADELGLDAARLGGAEGAAVFAGNRLPDGATPIAQAYAGHQFGGFSPQLGDGRALLLGEVIDRHGRRRDIAFKGSGRTPFSRGGDGKAAVGPMLREYLVGEAMHALGIPTTRALAVVATGEPVQREQTLPGAVLTRVAASHLRVGTFQYFAARGEHEQVRRLADYTLARHDPALIGRPDRYAGLLRAVAQRQAALIAQWMNVGFIHGVMNTDNMTLSGETIDYGPCAFMEAFDPAAVFSSIDHGGRYAYANQPLIARWNLARLAETLLPLLHDDADQAIALATEVIDAFPAWYEAQLLQGQRTKLGLHTAVADDAELAADWLTLLQAQQVDFTLGWRRLADAAAGDTGPLRALLAEPQAADAWLQRWQARCASESLAPQARAAAMRQVNPIVIPRNHRVEEALAAATEADLAPFQQLLAALLRPFDDDVDNSRYAQPAPREVTACYQTFCGT